MAFEFPISKPDSLFFPTVHIHDGKVHAMADFDHRLYCQPGEQHFHALMEWQESARPAMAFMDVKKSAGIVDGNAHCYLKQIRGQHKNEDVVLA
jgi:hypothetical protein